MNYIRHLNAFFSSVRSDKRLTSSHVSLYVALFQYWNYNRFQNPFPVYRENIMEISKIGSKNTYHKCMKELHHAKYIRYHPTVSKFQAVKISMLRLDLKEEELSFKQLDLFGDQVIENNCLGRQEEEENKKEKKVDYSEKQCPIIDTDSVPDLTATSTDFDTGTVPKMGHNIKLNNKQENSVYNTHKKNEGKNIKKQGNQNAGTNQKNKAKKNADGVPDLGHVKREITLDEITAFFQANQYPEEEAKKFLYYNKSKNWMLTDKMPVKDWQSLAHKWMLKATPSKTSTNVTGLQGFKRGSDIDADLQFLYERFLEGKQISKLVLPEYCNHLQLQLTDEIKQSALQRRINQLAGSNEHSESRLWEAYQGNNNEHELIKKDQPHLVSLAQRLAVLNHFEYLKQSGQTSITPIS